MLEIKEKVIRFGWVVIPHVNDNWRGLCNETKSTDGLFSKQVVTGRLYFYSIPKNLGYPGHGLHDEHPLQRKALFKMRLKKWLLGST